MSPAFLPLINISFNLNIYWSFISLFWHGFLPAWCKDMTLTASRAGGQSPVKPYVHEHIFSPFLKFVLLCDKQVLRVFWWEIRRSLISLQFSSITFLIPWMFQTSFLISTTLQLNTKHDPSGSAFQTCTLDCYVISAVPSVCDAGFMSSSVSEQVSKPFSLTLHAVRKLLVRGSE